MGELIPITPLFSYYTELHYKGAGKRNEKVYEQRLLEAKRLLRSPRATPLVEMFRESLRETEGYFRRCDYSDQSFYDNERVLNVDPGLESTDALARWLSDRRKQPWRVLGDDSLSFYYLDRELVSTRALGAKLADSRSSRNGPRSDLLLANASTRRPIIGEVKLTSHGSPDKDPFFALVQALASAAYLLPPAQLKRIGNLRHDPDARIDPESTQVDLYLLMGEAPELSPLWFELRDCAERLAAVLVPQISDRIHTIAGLELAWYEDRPERSRLRISKRFAHSPTEEVEEQ
jgi:hypothetical protein